MKLPKVSRSLVINVLLFVLNILQGTDVLPLAKMLGTASDAPAAAPAQP